MRFTDMETPDALLEQLRLLNARPDKPISMFDIGVPLIGLGYTQDQILTALFYLESKKTIELLPGNRLRLI